MLTTEEAGRRLATLHDDQWREKAMTRASGLPGALREPAQALLAPGLPLTAGPDETEAHRGRQLAAARALDQLTAPDLAGLMSALHPGLAAAFARWWADARYRPYARGWYRMTFRAPGNPECTAESRVTSLTRLLNAFGPYEADPVWLAIWGARRRAGTYSWGLAPSEIGGLLAAAIDLGDPAGDETLATLIEIGNGEHPTGMMGDHVITALLGSARPRAWDFVERWLLAAQRQEGLRQSILEAADEAHPAAFDRMVALILDQKLLRFAAAARAAGLWLGWRADIGASALTERRLRVLAACRASDADRAAALRSAQPWDVYLALRAGGMRDVFATFPEARALLSAPDPGLRAAAVRYAAATSVAAGQEIVAEAVDDPDPAVAALAAQLLSGPGLTRPGTFGALARLVSRLPAADQEVNGLGVEPGPVVVSRDAAARRLVDALGDRSVADLLPWLPLMAPDGRAAVARLITSGAGPERLAAEPGGGETEARPRSAGSRRAERAALPAELRPVVIGLLSDRSPGVRSIAIQALTAARLDPAEAPAIEALLTRAATDVRRGALTLLASLPSPDARASAARLAAGKVKRQRDAAAELLREIAKRDGSADVPGDGPGQPEDLHVTMTVNRTAPTPPRPAYPGSRPDPRAAAILQALDQVAVRHRDVPVTMADWLGGQQVLFGDVRFFPSPLAPHWMRPPRQPGRDTGPAALSLADGMALGAAFQEWWAGRPAALRGEDDGRDALRCFVLAAAGQLVTGAGLPSGLPAAALAEERQLNWWHAAERQLAGEPPEPLHHLAAVQAVTGWLTAEHASGPVVDECLDAVEAILAAVPQEMLAAIVASEMLTAVPTHDPQLVRSAGWVTHDDWRHRVPGIPWHRVLTALVELRPDLFTTARLRRWFGLMRWLERPDPRATAMPVGDELLAAAHRAGVASDDDAAAVFLPADSHPSSALFTDLTRHWRTRQEARYPTLVPVADRVRDRLVAVEARRGDLPTPTSGNARNISSVAGVQTAAALLANLGETPLYRGHNWGANWTSRAEVLSHLLRASFPAPGETGADLKAAADQARIADPRLVDLALYAPQWAQPVEEALGWPGLADGVLWLHAHTRDRQWSLDQELRDSWAALAAERTPLTADDLMDGAVDVEWFQRVYRVLGAVRWAALHAAAKHVSNGTGHRRAQLYSDAMLGLVSAGELRDRIVGKRYQDAVRALGLLPLPSADKTSDDMTSDDMTSADTTGANQDRRAAAIAARYAILREFERGSKAFGAERQANEKTAVRIGVENLARTAGYADPLRFTWAAEAREAADLADGPVSVTAGEVTVTLSVTGEGTPALAVARKGKALKAVPAALRKEPAVTALQGRKADLARQATRVRASLEAAMTTRDEFTEQDFAELRRHPVVAPMLARLVWVTADGATCLLMNGADGIDAGLASPAVLGPLRIAHPVDFIADGSWVHWQERLFALGWQQPFKQVFRELYVRTGQELTDGAVSHRYDGHQVQPRQAAALLTSRGWVSGYDTGEAARVFHRDRLVARVTFANGTFTPADAEPPMIDGVHFSRRGEYLAQPLDAVPPVVFSEAMRDLDLVVSVAHAGGVDPEATASTTEMRAALIRETARLMKLENIELAGAHAVIQGQLGEYSLHLGSGTVHRRPGGALCIVPVGAQHRGRLFLPFADDDPKTAEIIAKALLLARDHEIKDPTILEQFLPGGDPRTPDVRAGRPDRESARSYQARPRGPELPGLRRVSCRFMWAGPDRERGVSGAAARTRAAGVCRGFRVRSGLPGPSGAPAPYQFGWQDHR